MNPAWLNQFLISNRFIDSQIQLEADAREALPYVSTPTRRFCFAISLTYPSHSIHAPMN